MALLEGFEQLAMALEILSLSWKPELPYLDRLLVQEVLSLLPAVLLARVLYGEGLQREAGGQVGVVLPVVPLQGTIRQIGKAMQEAMRIWRSWPEFRACAA